MTPMEVEAADGITSPQTLAEQAAFLRQQLGLHGNLKEVVHGAAAANEVARYVCRLNAKDWSIKEMPFDFQFETLFLGFWSWKGVLQVARCVARSTAEPIR